MREEFVGKRRKCKIFILKSLRVNRFVKYRIMFTNNKFYLILLVMN